jgi:hypothetical protein
MTNFICIAAVQYSTFATSQSNKEKLFPFMDLMIYQFINIHFSYRYVKQEKNPKIRKVYFCFR